MVDPSVSMLQYAVGNAMPLRLSVRDGEGPPRVAEVGAPFAIVGRSPQCDVALSEQGVAFRHVYLQAIGGRVACIDLLSPSGIHWDGPPFQGWLSPAHRFRIGGCWLQLFDDGWSTEGDLKSPLEFKPRSEHRPEYGLLPQVDLELQNTSGKGSVWPINRIITLLGRDDRCRITCADEAISKVHCSLLLLPTGLWVIDLLGKSGVKVNGEAVRFAVLPGDCQLEIGKYVLSPRYTPNAAAVSAPVTTASPNARDAESALFLTRHNRLFPVSVQGNVLILHPRGDVPNLLYKEMHIEASRVNQLLATKSLGHLVVDGGCAPVLTSIVIDMIIGFCRAVRGKAAFCHLSPAVAASIQSMNLDRIWPVFATQAEAVHSVST